VEEIAGQEFRGQLGGCFVSVSSGQETMDQRQRGEGNEEESAAAEGGGERGRCAALGIKAPTLRFQLLKLGR
jgi:hypothetical protein